MNTPPVLIELWVLGFRSKPAEAATGAIRPHVWASVRSCPRRCVAAPRINDRPGAVYFAAERYLTSSFLAAESALAFSWLRRMHIRQVRRLLRVVGARRPSAFRSLCEPQVRQLDVELAVLALRLLVAETQPDDHVLTGNPVGWCRQRNAVGGLHRIQRA